MAFGLLLETERLRLRPLTPGDVDGLLEVLGDAETMRWYPAPFDREGVVAWIQRALDSYEQNGFGLLAIEERASGDFVGDCGPTIQLVEEEPHVELGWHVRRDRWGRGIATEGGAACRDWCFANLDVDHLISLIRPENRQSWRVAEKLGFTTWRATMRAGYRHYVFRLDRAT
jgi:[ribosomal protein S5]-alanine N-acetyltransferase